MHGTACNPKMSWFWLEPGTHQSRTLLEGAVSRLFLLVHTVKTTCIASASMHTVTVARTRRQNALDASTAPLYYYHDRVQHRYTRPPLRPSRPDLRPHRDSNQRPPTHGPPCRTHGQEFWTLTGLELATCGSVPKTHATSRPLHYCVANLAPNQDVTVARTRRQNVCSRANVLMMPLRISVVAVDLLLLLSAAIPSRSASAAAAHALFGHSIESLRARK